MPLFDFPLARLQEYQGSTPRPADFDAYWDEALRELDLTPPRPEFTSCEPFPSKSVECSDLWFTGIAGARVHAKFLRPVSASANRARPAVLMFHGYGGHSGEWSDKLAYVSQGFCVAALDCRGQGGPSEDVGVVKGPTIQGHIVRGLEDPDPKRLMFRSIFLDTVQLARVVLGLPDVNPERVGCVGGSQGGALALACAALEPRVKRAAIAHPFLCDYQRVWEMDLVKDAYAEIRTFFRHFDPRHERRVEIFTKLGYIDCQNLAARVRGEVLMFTGLMDTVCPPSTQFAAYNKFTVKKQMVIYPDYAHEGGPGQADRTLAFMMGM